MLISNVATNIATIANTDEKLICGWYSHNIHHDIIVVRQFMISDFFEKTCTNSGYRLFLPHPLKAWV